MIRLFKSKIYISIFALILVLIIALSVDAAFFYTALLGALLHEFAHIAVMKMLGAKLIRVSIYPFGADINADTSALSYKSETAIFLAGPAVSLVLTVIAFIFYIRLGGIYILSFSISNFLFFFINILPVKGLDGGRALESILFEKYDLVTAEKMADTVSTVFFIFLCILALLLIFLSGYNLSLAFICAYLFISEYVKQRLCSGILV